MRVRGLKPYLMVEVVGGHVAPHAGAWIETRYRWYSLADMVVAPHAGAWIETVYAVSIRKFTGCRTPCGCVD